MGGGERPKLAPGVLQCCNQHFVYGFHGLLYVFETSRGIFFLLK